MLASLLVVWVTFVPSFLFIFLGAPYVERLRGNTALSAALTGVTAAVVGVIANLALYFAVHTLFSETQRWGWPTRPAAAGVGAPTSGSPSRVLASPLALVFRLRWSVLRTLGACALGGLGLSLLT